MYDSRLELLGRFMSRVILSFTPDLTLLVLFIILLLIIGLAQILPHDDCVCVEDSLCRIIWLWW